MTYLHVKAICFAITDSPLSIRMQKRRWSNFDTTPSYILTPKRARDYSAVSAAGASATGASATGASAATDFLLRRVRPDFLAALSLSIFSL
mgnify:CR=1 FL=1